MCSQCGYCLKAKGYTGMQRGLMDCDPPEYWCSAENEYYDLEDYEIEAMLRERYITELIERGYSEEEAEDEAEQEDFEVECPDYIDSY